jgi:hypothetical protein
MRVTIANISKSVPLAKFQAAVGAIARQVTEDFEPEWKISANLRGATLKLTRSAAPIDGIHDAIIYLGDASQDPTTGVDNALGYHARNFRRIPYGFVYLDVCAQYGEDWTCTLSHEALELLGDPTAAMTVAGPDPRRRGRSVYYDLEVCDPTQGDAYQIDSVAVSNFVGRRYFGLTGGSGATNFMKLALRPFGVRPKGYLQYEDGHKTHQIDGERVTKKHKDARALMKAARRNFRRSARLG